MENSEWGIHVIQKYLYFLKQPRGGPDPPLNIAVDNVVAVLGWWSAKVVDQYCLRHQIGSGRAKRGYQSVVNLKFTPS